MSFSVTKNYTTILQSLKEKIRQARLRAVTAVNKELLAAFWEIGDTVDKQEKAEGWGAKIVDRLAADLKSEFPDMQGLSPRNLRYMRDFALAYPQFTILQQTVAKPEGGENHQFIILQQAVAKLPWGHNCVLLDKLKLPEERLFYAEKTIQNGWTRAMMINQIEGGLYKRQGAITNNFGATLPAYESELAVQLFKDPYHLDFVMLNEEAKERDLENALLNQITKLLLELGDGFAFMGRQKRFEAGGKEFFIDLLFYHTKLRRHIIIELKIGEFEAEFISKMNLYLGIADDNLKGEHDEPAIGLILCKTNNKIIAEYALRDTSKPIGIAEYKISEKLPKSIKSELPSIKEIEQRMGVELKESLSPIDARLKAVKDKLKTTKTGEISTEVTNGILMELFNKGLRVLYEQIIEKLTDEFKEAFLKLEFKWIFNSQVVYSISEIQVLLEENKNVKSIREIKFEILLDGFKKGGTENYNEFLELRFAISTYSYSFYLTNYNDSEAILKKAYPEQISKEEIRIIEDAILSKILDKIEWILERIQIK